MKTKAQKKAARTKKLRKLKNLGLPSPAEAKRIAARREQEKKLKEITLNSIGDHSAAGN